MGKHQKIVATDLQNIYDQTWLYVEVAQYVSVKIIGSFLWEIK